MNESDIPGDENPYENKYAGDPEIPAEASQETNTDARTWGMLAHLSALSGYVIPFGNIIGPLVVWMIKKDEYEFVNDQGKESLNFQISITIYLSVAALSICIGVGIVLLPIVAIAGLVFIIVAGISAYGGNCYRYPLTIRLIK